jgi:LysR family transcriptional activator of nhaA
MVDTVKGRSAGQPLRLDVGIANVVPKLVVQRILRPALSLPESVRLVCYEQSYEKLLADLALHTLDIVISDSPVPAGSNVRGFNHLLGETGVSFFAVKGLAKAYKRQFPASLDGAPMLLPLEQLALRRSLNQWFDRNEVKPRVVAEFEDSALMQVFGSEGLGIFAAPSVVEDEVIHQSGVEVVGRTEQVRERFYAISVERRLKNPAVVAICDVARQELFASR